MSEEDEDEEVRFIKYLCHNFGIIETEFNHLISNNEKEAKLFNIIYYIKLNVNRKLEKREKKLIFDTLAKLGAEGLELTYKKYKEDYIVHLHKLFVDIAALWTSAKQQSQSQ